MSNKSVFTKWRPFSSTSSQKEEILLESHGDTFRPDHTPDQQRYIIPSPTLSYYANFVPATPAPPAPSNVHQPMQAGRIPRRMQPKPKPAPIDMARIRKASSKRPPKVVVTCDVDGLPEVEDERTGYVEVGRLELDVVEVQSSRASVGDMRILSDAARHNVGSTEKKPKNEPTLARRSSPSIVEIEPGHRFPSWMGGTDYHHLLIDSQSQSRATSRASSPLPRARGNRVSPLTPKASTHSPESGGPLHQILLTPISPSDHSWSTDDLFGRNKRGNNEKSGTKSGKRRTLVDVATKLLAEKRTRWLRDRSQVHDSPYTDVSRENANHIYGPSAAVGSDGYPGALKSGTREASKHDQSGYGLSDSKMAWAARERRVISREEARRKARRNRWAIIVALIVLVICSVVIGVCVTLLGNRHSSAQTSESEGTTNSLSDITSVTSVSAAAKATSTASTTYNLDTCLQLFTLSAPSSPLTYPCDQCLGPLSVVSNDFAADATAEHAVKGVGSALQFCALQAIYKNTDGTAPVSSNSSTSSALSGWMQDTNVCAGWTGLRCDSQGRVTSLSLVYPNVPKTMDSSLKYLVAIQSLKVVGNSNIPSGAIPDSILPLTLSSIDIQSTNLNSFSDKSFAGSIEKLQTLMLVSNSKLGNSLPNLSASGLQTLSVTGQSLTEDPSNRLPRSLTFLDLSYNSLSGPVPDLASLSSLKSLFLDANAYTAFPTALPSSLQELSLNGNSKLNGTIPSAFCNAPNLTSCDFRGSQLSPAPGNVTTSTRTVSSISRGVTATSVVVSTVVATATATPSCGICRFK